jgi:indolepyruvate ferredoxin oxidoreductase alpha subunit
MEIEKLAKGCGVDFIHVVDPYDIPLLIHMLKEADQYARGEEKGVAVIITRHPCLIYGSRGERRRKGEIVITEECDLCGLCTGKFECPALQKDPEGKPIIAKVLCANCDICLYVCPKGAIERS